MKTGTDVLENARFINAINRNQGRLRNRLFTEVELAQNPQDLDLAIMFSAKESIAKALGTGFDSYLSWHDVSIIVNGTNVIAALSGRALELAGTQKLSVSATQDTNTSYTFVLLSGEE